MAITVGRLAKAGFAKRGAFPITQPASGGFIPPDQAVRFIPPWDWEIAQTTLESSAISGVRDLPTKAVKGPGTITGKTNVELEPSNVVGNLLMAGFGQDTVGGDGAATAHAHMFTSLQAAQLPSYDWWDNTAVQQRGFAGALCKKFSLIGKGKETWRLEGDWLALYPVDGLALSPALIYPTVRPLTFAQSEVKLGGAPVYNVTDIKIDGDNGGQEDHAIQSDSNFANMAFNEHFAVTAEVTMRFENETEYDKFLAALSPSTLAATSLEVILTSAETVTEGALTVPLKYDWLIPNAFYKTFKTPLPSGVVMATFSLGALPSSGNIGAGSNVPVQGYIDKALIVQFVNGSATPF